MRTLTLALAMALLAPTIAAQEVEFETGKINFGPVVTEEVESFVRFGQDGGMEGYYAWTVLLDRWWVSMRLAPTSLYRWSTDDTEHRFGKYGADPTHSRFRYRVKGHRDDFVWAELLAGPRTTVGPLELRAGLGVVRLSATDHTFWGASTSPKPVGEIGIGLQWRFLHGRCRGAAVHVGEPFGRWSVLEHAARDVGDSSVRRTIKPLACGFGVRFGF